MPRQPNDSVVNKPALQSEKARRGRQRVARRFLPDLPAAALIRLDHAMPRARNRLARLIDRRDVVS